MMAGESRADLFTGLNDINLLVLSKYEATMSNPVVVNVFNTYNKVVGDIPKYPVRSICEYKKNHGCSACIVSL